MVLSRESHVAACGVETFMQTVLYDERETYSGLGRWSTDLAHAPLHTESVTADRMEGDFYGVESFNSRELRNETSESGATVRFAISGAPATLTLTCAGRTDPGNGPAENGNYSFVIVNVATGEVAFDIFRDATDRMSEAFRYREATNLVRTLDEGVYELQIRTIHRYVNFRGGGVSSGGGSLTFGMNIVPAPATLALAVVVPVRRKRS